MRLDGDRWVYRITWRYRWGSPCTVCGYDSSHNTSNKPSHCMRLDGDRSVYRITWRYK